MMSPMYRSARPHTGWNRTSYTYLVSVRHPQFIAALVAACWISRFTSVRDAEEALKPTALGLTQRYVIRPAFSLAHR